MEATVEAIQDIVSTDPESEEPAATSRPDDAAIELQLTEEISTLWSSHVKLSAERKVSSKELGLIRMKLAEKLHAMKSILCCPGRGGQWRSWLRERRIPRSTADGLVARYTENASADEGNVPSQAIPDKAVMTPEKLANVVWSRFGKFLVTADAVIDFIGHLAELSGVGHSQREDGLLIINIPPHAVDAVTASGVSAEAICPAPQSYDGDGSPVDTPAADPGPQISDGVPAAVDELLASAPATDRAPQHYDANDPNPIQFPPADPPHHPSDALAETATPGTAQGAATPIEVTPPQEPSNTAANPTENVPPAGAIDDGESNEGVAVV